MKSMVKVFWIFYLQYKVVHDVSVGIIFPDPCYQQDHILEGELFKKRSLHLLTWSIFCVLTNKVMWSFDATMCSEALTALVGSIGVFFESIFGDLEPQDVSNEAAFWNGWK